MRIFKSHPILSIVNGMLIDLPAPSNLNYLWGFGSLLGLCLVIQLASGIFLAMHYTGNVDLAFISVEHIMRDVNYGWLLRYIHANGASMFFICVFMHIGRGIYHGSYTSPREMVWGVGVVLLIVMMATAFIGFYFGRRWDTFMSNLYSYFTYNNGGRGEFLPYNRVGSGGSNLPGEGSGGYNLPGELEPNNEDFDISKEKIFKNAVKVYDNLHLVETQILIREENRRKAGVYILYNKLNGKFYVGSAITNRINTRFRNHCFHGTGSSVTKRAICRYGVENFYFIIYQYFPGIILKDNLKTENLKLLAMESAAISDLNPSYNIPVNSKGYIHTAETKAHLKQNNSQERKEIANNLNCPLSESRIQFYIDNPEHVEYLRKLASKPVALYDFNGNHIKSYPGIRVLCKEYGWCNKTVNKALKNGTPVKNQYVVKYIAE